MTERRRNLAVGVTVLAALCALGYMILLFGRVPSFARGGYKLTIDFPSAANLHVGAEVHLNGIPIGRVTKVRLRTDPRAGVQVACRIDADASIPDDSLVAIAHRGLGGTAYVTLAARRPADLKTPVRPLATDGTARLRGTISPGGILAGQGGDQLKKIAEGLGSFARLADNLNRLIEPPTADPNGPSTLGETLNKLNRVLDSLSAITADADNQQNIRDALANLRQVTQRGVETMDQLGQFAAEARKSLEGVDAGVAAATDLARETQRHIDTLATRLIADADELGRLLSSLNRAAAKLDSGDGAAAKFLNDPKLYNNLLESTRQLGRTLAEMQAAVKTWREGGLRVKFK